MTNDDEEAVVRLLEITDCGFRRARYTKSEINEANKILKTNFTEKVAEKIRQVIELPLSA